MLGDAPVAVISDALDRMGRRHQVLDLAIRPLWPEARLAGSAVPVVIVADTSEPELPYDGELTALDGLRPGDVPLFVVEEGVRCASWGELFSCAALGRGAAESQALAIYQKLGAATRSDAVDLAVDAGLLERFWPVEASRPPSGSPSRA